jgi:hypothetical protein
MASITIDEQHTWVVAGWAFRRLVERACEEVSREEDIRELRQAPALGGLHFNLLEQGQRVRLVSALRAAARAVRADVMAGSSDDPRDREYSEALTELDRLLGLEPPA